MYAFQHPLSLPNLRAELLSESPVRRPLYMSDPNTAITNSDTNRHTHSHDLWSGWKLCFAGSDRNPAGYADSADAPGRA